ncbi:MAG: leucine-rich repeat domain-containing protein [Oscillospiraceae bacterium]|nr:leucine-rich repeat domain-containing protein [Oscillospiraceae bacterium]
MLSSYVHDIFKIPGPNLRHHYLPSDLQVIEEEAFRGAEIWYLIAPAGCELIETGVFADSPLEYLRVGANTVIEDGALADSVVVDRR